MVSAAGAPVLFLPEKVSVPPRARMPVTAASGGKAQREPEAFHQMTDQTVDQEENDDDSGENQNQTHIDFDKTLS